VLLLLSSALSEYVCRGSKVKALLQVSLYSSTPAELPPVALCMFHRQDIIFSGCRSFHFPRVRQNPGGEKMIWSRKNNDMGLREEE